VAVTTSARASASSRATSASGSRPVNVTVGPAMRRSRRASGPLPMTMSGSRRLVNARTATSIRLCGMSSDSTTYASLIDAAGVKRDVSTGGCRTAASRLK
jgi:hypothetical protein